MTSSTFRSWATASILFQYRAGMEFRRRISETAEGRSSRKRANKAFPPKRSMRGPTRSMLDFVQAKQIAVNMNYVDQASIFTGMGEIHDRLKQARIAAGFASAAEAADALGITASSYRAHENGQNDYGPDDARRYARRFGVQPAWLILGDETRTTTAEEKRFLELLANVNEPRRQRLLKAFAALVEASDP